MAPSTSAKSTNLNIDKKDLKKMVLEVIKDLEKEEETFFLDKENKKRITGSNRAITQAEKKMNDFENIKESFKDYLNNLYDSYGGGQEVLDNIKENYDTVSKYLNDKTNENIAVSAGEAEDYFLYKNYKTSLDTMLTLYHRHKKDHEEFIHSLVCL